MPPQTIALTLAGAITNITPFVDAFKLPVEIPVLNSHVRTHNISDSENGQITLTNGATLGWRSRGVFYYEGLDLPMQNGSRLQPSVTSAIKQAREGVLKLGYSLDRFNMHLPPTITTNDYIEIAWYRPQMQNAKVFEISISPKHGATLALDFEPLSPAPRQDEVIVWTRGSNSEPPPQLLGATNQILAFARIVGLPTLFNVTSNDFVKWTATDSVPLADGPINGKVSLERGYSFEFVEGRIYDFEAPDLFFVYDRDVSLRDFRGNVRISDRAAIERARSWISNLGWTPNRSWWAKKPEMDRPYIGTGLGVNVPRLLLTWQDLRDETGNPSIRVEIDTSDGSLKSLNVTGVPFKK